MKIKILMLTHQRCDYTRLALSRLCDTIPAEAGVTIWDNNSGRAMREILKNFEEHPRIDRIVYSPHNEKLRTPTNWFWEQSGEAEFLSKVDDDCLMSPGWCDTLVRAHQDTANAGILGCWRFPEEDFIRELAYRKIQSFGAHRIMRNCWVEGSGYIMKREVLQAVGPLRDRESFTGWCIRAADAGYINGWYYPFIQQEHMDDPRAPHSGIRNEEDFARLRPLSARTFKLDTLSDWTNWMRRDARNLQRCSFQPRDYIGRKAAIRAKLGRFLGYNLTPSA